MRGNERARVSCSRRGGSGGSDADRVGGGDRPCGTDRVGVRRIGWATTITRTPKKTGERKD